MTTKANLAKMIVKALNADSNPIGEIAEYAILNEIQSCQSHIILNSLELLCKRVENIQKGGTEK